MLKITTFATNEIYETDETQNANPDDDCLELDLDMIDEHNVYFRVINKVEESYMKQKQRRCKECSYYMHKRANKYNDEIVAVCGKNGEEITNLQILLSECEILNKE